MEKKKVKLSVFSDDVLFVIHRKPQKFYQKKNNNNLLELINEFSKVAG